MGRPTKLIIDTEAYIMTASETEGVYGIPRDTISIKNELQQVLHLVGKIRIVDKIKQNSTYKYSHRVLFCKLIRDKIRGVKNTSNHGMIKVSGIIHKRLKESDPRIAWLMLQTIYLMNGDINNKEEIYYVMLIKSMSSNILAKNQNEKIPTCVPLVSASLTQPPPL